MSPRLEALVSADAVVVAVLGVVHVTSDLPAEVEAMAEEELRALPMAVVVLLMVEVDMEVGDMEAAEEAADTEVEALAAGGKVPISLPCKPSIIFFLPLRLSTRNTPPSQSLRSASSNVS
jgi:hypothetical protein